jgi:pyruvate/2-oxoacid:ferredoxin oxidoreductase alpha subunit
MSPPGVYMEMRRSIQAAMEDALAALADVEEEFSRMLGRRYGPIEAVHCEDAEVILVTSGTVTSTSRQVIAELRARGEKVGLLKIKLFRPFPVESIRAAMGRVRKVAVIDRNFSFGASGIFAQEIRAALCNLPGHPAVFGYIAGLGGRDVTTAIIEEIYIRTRDAEAPREESTWMGLQEVKHAP